MSSRSYLSAPARSAWPGRGRVTGALRAPVASGGGSGADVHRVLPVGPVAVAHDQRDRPAQRLALADAGQHLGRIGLDGHAPAAAVAALASLEIGGGDRRIDHQPRRQPLDDDDERLTVRLAGREKSQHRRQLYMMQFLPLFSAAAAPRAAALLRDRGGAAGFLHSSCACRRTCRGCWSASSMRDDATQALERACGIVRDRLQASGAWVHAASAHVLSRAGTASARRVDAVVARALATGRSVRTPIEGLEVHDGARHAGRRPAPRWRCRCGAAARRWAR